MPDFDIRVTQYRQGPVVFIRGDLTLATAGEFRKCLHDLAGQTIVIDCSEVTFMDSTALGILIAVHNRAVEIGGSVMLHGVQPAQVKPFKVTGLTEYFELDSEDASA